MKTSGAHLTNYYSRVVADANNGLVPVLSTNSSTARLIGTVPLPNTNYPTAVIDVYIPDPEGITNGIAANIPELPDGFIQGKTYLGSFVVDGTGDLDPAPGAFQLDITSLGVPANTQLTVTANYSQKPVGAPNARFITSLFARPVTAKLAAGLPLTIGSITRNGAILTISWSGANPPFQLQTNANLVTGSWGNYGPSLNTNTATIPVISAVPQTYLRLVGH